MDTLVLIVAIKWSGNGKNKSNLMDSKSIMLSHNRCVFHANSSTLFGDDKALGDVLCLFNV